MRHDAKETMGTDGHDRAVLSARTTKDSFSGVGEVLVRPFTLGPDGERAYEESLRYNLIVRQGRSTLIDLLTGGSRKRLKFIRWGSGGAPVFPDGDPLEPFDVNDTDTDVAAPVLDKLLNTPQRVGPTEVRYSETVISDEVDADISEAALLFEDPVDFSKSIFSRITFPTNRLRAEQGTGIEIVWTIRFDKVSEESV